MFEKEKLFKGPVVLQEESHGPVNQSVASDMRGEFLSCPCCSCCVNDEDGSFT